MANKLKIYACSGIGKQDDYVQYWSDNTNVATNTQAVNTLLSYINLRYAEITRLQLSEEERLNKLNQIDIATVCLHAADVYTKQPLELHRAGCAIATMIKKGVFDSNIMDLNQRDKNLDEILDMFDTMMQDQFAEDANSEFLSWYFDKVETRDKRGFTKEQVKAGEDVLNSVRSISGIGVNEAWRNDASISDCLINSSDYYLYLFFTEEQLNNLPYQYKVKKRYQQRVYNNCKGVFTKLYGTEDEMMQIIRTGIISIHGLTPEEECNGLYEIDRLDKENRGVGFNWTIFIVVLGLIISFIEVITKLIKACLDYALKTDQARYQAMQEDLIADNAPSPDDVESQEALNEWKREQQKEQVKSLIKPGLILGGIMMLFNR